MMWSSNLRQPSGRSSGRSNRRVRDPNAAKFGNEYCERQLGSQRGMAPRLILGTCSRRTGEDFRKKTAQIRVRERAYPVIAANRDGPAKSVHSPRINLRPNGPVMASPV
jgi:hypothetical protein